MSANGNQPHFTYNLHITNTGGYHHDVSNLTLPFILTVNNPLNLTTQDTTKEPINVGNVVRASHGGGLDPKRRESHLVLESQLSEDELGKLFENGKYLDVNSYGPDFKFNIFAERKGEGRIQIKGVTFAKPFQPGDYVSIDEYSEIGRVKRISFPIGPGVKETNPTALVRTIWDIETLVKLHDRYRGWK
ncbi:hypothetical protein ISS05_00400 [Candidatus Woesearchaeota archaeon]|nr:hypothetical protein [Candidatus Woesearchaeota archaeon]